MNIKKYSQVDSSKDMPESQQTRHVEPMLLGHQHTL